MEVTRTAGQKEPCGRVVRRYLCDCHICHMCQWWASVARKQGIAAEMLPWARLRGVARTLHSGEAMVVEPAGPAAPTLEQLMDRYVDGNDAAFTALYRRMLPKLSGHLAKICRDQAVVEDALQSAFTKIHRARGSYSKGSPVAPWALVIARRALYDELRANRARPDVLTETGSLPELPTDDGPAKEQARRLERALSTLPGHYREAIELTKLHGLSGDEAAKVLSTTQSAVKLRVHRAYRMLRRTLEEAQAA